MKILLYNTLKRDKQELQPIQAGKVGIYTCGPTVYGRAHIGNMRAYIFADILRRVLEYNRFDVRHVMNITDVGHLESDADEGEDKMEMAARERGKSPWEIAEEFTQLFYKDSQKLNIKRPSVVEKATDHINEMIEFVQGLLTKGYAYEISDGIYYDISKYPQYGQLSRIILEEQQAGARVAVNEEKRNPYDFALWKKASKEHIMQWESPWGMGYPGWHIECSVLSRQFLGDVFDIHTGGVDHIPIHHENEIAQSIGLTGQMPANIWMHSEFLQVDKGKMSKSLGNVYSVEDMEDKGYDPLAFRYMSLNAHYRKQLNFTWNILDSSQTALQRLRQGVARLSSGQENTAVDLTKYKSRFLEAINDDLNLPKAMAVVWEIVRGEHRGKAVLDLLEQFDTVLGLDLLKGTDETENKVTLTPELMALIQQREDARKTRNWAKADEIRDMLMAKGVILIDTKNGTVWKLK